jgi:hypothetical protein
VRRGLEAFGGGDTAGAGRTRTSPLPEATRDALEKGLDTLLGR